MAATLLDSGSVRLVPQFLTGGDELFEQLAATIPWDDRMKARKVASFGAPYNYSGIEWPAAPLPERLAPVLDRVAEAVGWKPNNCLVNYYPSGDSTMGFHSDSTDNLAAGTGVAVVSLGAERVITFRRIDDKSVTESYRLRSGSLLCMTPEMQSIWRHAILAEAAVANGRISLTFRQIKA